jgi:hypothetical protein
MVVRFEDKKNRSDIDAVVRSIEEKITSIEKPHPETPPRKGNV